MRKTTLAIAVCFALLPLLGPSASSQQVLAQQQTVTFVCNAPSGHVCQFVVRTGASPVSFALASGERQELAGITPGTDQYCVCDPGPVTPDCKAPRIDHWCLGLWSDVTPGLNSQNEAKGNRFARQ
jgi:hypothetical protein